MRYHNVRRSQRKSMTFYFQTSITLMNVIKKSFTHVPETAKNSENETFNKKLEDKISAFVKQEVGFWDALG